MDRKLLAALLIASLPLLGCGNKGPLVLAPDAPPPPYDPATANDVPSEEEDADTTLPPAETLPDATLPESASTTTTPTDAADPTPPVVVPGSDGTPGQH
jgi:predicted small lipoprotein YifL